MKLDLCLHVFDEGDFGTTPDVRHYQIDAPDEVLIKGCNPLLLVFEQPFKRADRHLFTLEYCVCDVYYYHPYATHTRLSLVDNLIEQGWQKAG